MDYYIFLYFFFLYKLIKHFFFYKKFKHKCVLITGGAGSLGIELAKRFLKNKKTTVILVDISTERLEIAKKNLPGVRVERCDITNYEECTKLINKLLTDYKVDTLINNAGIVSKKPFLQLTNKDIETTFKVNAIAPIYLTKLLLPRMIKEQRGHIVNISSVAGLVGANKLTDYCASKFALVGFHAALRTELFKYNNIHTTCICPYFFHSELFKVTKGYPWPLNKFVYVYSVNEIATLVYNDIKSVKEMSIYPKIFGWLLRVRYIFPNFIQDRFITLGSTVG